MNRLPLEKRCKIIQLLVEGNSLRASSRIADVAFNTVLKLVKEIGQVCMTYHDNTIRDIVCQRVQCDEIWSFVYSKQKNTPEDKKGAGDVWTWVAIDADSKLIISWYLGSRETECATIFMKDVANRLKNPVQLTSDGFRAYLEAVKNAFDKHVDFAQLVKMYGSKKSTSAHPDKSKGYCRYVGAEKVILYGKPNPKFISTSYIERQNLSMRMHMRRFTRKTNAFSKKVENHCYALALYFVYYNFVRIHSSLRVTPAMQAGLTKKPMTIKDIAQLSEKISK
jgi:IS1 family transposase